MTASDNHPLVALALRMITPGATEPHHLDAAATDKLAEQLARITDPTELCVAVTELCTLAGWLALDKGSPGAAEAIFQAAETAVDALRAISGTSTISTDVVAEVRTKVIGGRRDLLDPKPAPEGSTPSGPMARFQLNAPKH